ncbi:cupin domain-containing protein [Streptomyces sp. RK31]|uniref:cupin domain-containing protein n=1 Tax=Streptomyces sp. RK31 TaxID=2824892 RepID=UPI001B36886A|nr:cupin domain-containing protein [Streptomyces sp. RK31]MBQ0975637.1 cupin domain-containing protein [Streptomyces sp. RK31]
MLQVGPVRTRVLEDGTETGGMLGFAELTLPPGCHGPPQHVHREHAEFFYVLEGPVRFDSADSSLMVESGHLAVAPVDVPHTFSNPRQDRQVRMLFLAAPRPYVGYFRALDRLGVAGELTPEVVAEAMRDHATRVWRP